MSHRVRLWSTHTLSMAFTRLNYLVRFLYLFFFLNATFYCNVSGSSLFISRRRANFGASSALRPFVCKLATIFFVSFIRPVF